LSDFVFSTALDIYNDESGLGYCLRAASQNGGRLISLKSLVGIGACERFKSDHAHRIARLFNVDEAVLGNKLPRDVKRQPIKTYCYGQAFRSLGSLRSRRPQICPVCISVMPYLKDSWDIGLSTCCLIHKVRLVDCCLKCGASVRWDRPSVAWGHCGHHLGGDGTKASNALLIAQHLFENTLRPCSTHKRMLGGQLLCVLSFLTLDGLIQVLSAFGILERAWAAILPGGLLRCPSSTDAAALVERAIQRVQILGNDLDARGGICSLIAEVPLLTLMIDPASCADRDVSMGLYEMLFGFDALEKIRRRYPELRQMRLFEGLK
jgi:hypothetical protein